MQVNGKLRSRLTVPPDIAEPALQALALGDPAVLAHTAGKTVRKIIVAKGRLVNVVAN